MKRILNITDKSCFLLSVSLLICIFLSIISCAKEPEKKYLIGTINPNPKLAATLAKFKKAMTEHGYIEGENVTYIDSAGGKGIDSALKDFQEKKVDLVLTITTPAMKKSVEALRESGIPVVGLSYDPVSGGVVKSLIYKKENVTGIKVGGSVPKALEWLLLIVPDIRHIFVPVKLDTPAADLSLNDLKGVALKLDVELQISEIETTEDLKISLSSMPEDIDAVFVPHSILVVSNLDTIIKTCIKRRIPSVSGSGLYQQGIAISYGENYNRTGKELSKIVHKVLQGTPAFSQPFETAEFHLGINLHTLKSIGLDIPYYVKQAYTIDE